MARIALLENHPDNVEPSQMFRMLNELIMEINKVIAPLPDPPAEPGPAAATGATATVHPAPHAANQRGHAR